MQSTTAKDDVQCTMYKGQMYDVQIYDVRRMYDLPLAGFPIYAADNRPFKKKRTREDALFLPSYINCTLYIVHRT